MKGDLDTSFSGQFVDEIDEVKVRQYPVYTLNLHADVTDTE